MFAKKPRTPLANFAGAGEKPPRKLCAAALGGEKHCMRRTEAPSALLFQ